MNTQKDNRLRGLVVSHFGSVAKLAKAIHWSYAKTYRIVSGTQEPGAAEINTLTDALPMMTAEDILELFILPWRSQNANQ